MRSKHRVMQYQKVQIESQRCYIYYHKTDEAPVQLQDPNPLPPPPPSGSCMEAVSADVLTFSYQDLVEATEDFSSQYIIGNGGFGVVYKASIRSHGPFAIKKIHKVLKFYM